MNVMERRNLPVFVLKVNNSNSTGPDQNSSAVYLSSQHVEVPEFLKRAIKLENSELPDDVNTNLEIEQDDYTVMSEMETDKQAGVELEDSVTTESALGLVSAENMMGLCGNLEESSKEDDTTFAFGEDDVLIQHMDIREPLSKLRLLLEERLGCSLSDYEFWLQDAQVLAPHKNLVDQCVQGEGIVQVNFQIKTDGDLKKINIVDVLKPTEDFIAMGQQQFEQPSIDTAPPIEKKQNVIRWIVDSQFKKDQERLNIPTDPHEWTVVHVRHWLLWAVRQFNLVGLQLRDWTMTGQDLCEMTLSDFQKIVPSDPRDVFWTHLELLRRCHFVAVVQKDKEEKAEALQFKGKIPKQGRILKLPRVIGLPLNSLESSGCGNRTGNNGQIQLWQFLLELLTDKDHTEIIHWVGTSGEFKLNHPEMVALLWGSRKNKPNMNYEKLSRALRYYYDGHMISKVHGKRFVYKFVCNLKQLLGYSAGELSRLVNECRQKSFGVDVSDLEAQLSSSLY